MIRKFIIFSIFAVVCLLAPVAFAQAWAPGTYSGNAVYGEPAPAQGFFPTLPQFFVDNNEATDGLAYSLPSTYYELILGAGAGGIGAWCSSGCTGISGAPSSGSYTLANYTATGAGKQNAINDLEAARTAHGYGFIIDQPPSSTQGAYAATNSTAAAGTYQTTSGVVIPQTNTAPATTFIIVRSTQSAALAAMNMPVGAGGIQDVVSESVYPGLINADLTGQNLAYQTVIGGVTTVVNILEGGAAAPGITFPYSFPCGATCPTYPSSWGSASALAAAYNYLQYMYQDVCTGTGTACTPIQFCTPLASSSNACANATNNTGGCATANTCIAPDHWLLEDGAASVSAGNPSASDIISITNPCVNGSPCIQSVSQFSQHIHIRRYWAHADYVFPYNGSYTQAAALSAGGNTMSVGFDFFTCMTCSLVDSQVSEAIRPGEEGHAVNASGVQLKIDFNWLEGQSSCIFPAGFSYVNGVPFTDVGAAPYIALRDSEIRRTRCSFPYGWLGFQGTPGNPQSYKPTVNNAFGGLPDTNYQWGGAGDAYPYTSAAVTLFSVSGSGPYTITATSTLNPGVGNSTVQLSGFIPTTGGVTLNGTYSTLTSTSSQFTFQMSYSPTVTTYGTAMLANPVCPTTSGTGVTCVDVASDGITITPHGGTWPTDMPPFHDANSAWGNGTKTVLINNDGNKYTINTISGSGSCSGLTYAAGCPSWAVCPASLVLKNAKLLPGAPLTNVPFVYQSPNIVRKNGEEFKEANRAVMDGMIIENNDNSGGQNGTIGTFNVRNCSGGCQGQNYQSAILNWRFSNFVMRNACRGYEYSGRASPGGGDGGGSSGSMNWVSTVNGIIYNISGANNGCPNGAGDLGIYINSGGESWNSTISGTGSSATAIGFASIDLGTQATATVYPGTGGSSYTDYTTPGQTAAANTAICGPGNSIYINGFGNSANNSTAAGFVCHSSAANLLTLANASGVTLDTAATAFNNANPVVTNTVGLGFQAMNISTASPVLVSGCTVKTGFNTGTATWGVHTQPVLGALASAGSAAWNGTFAASNLTVSFPSTVSGNDSAGGCVVTNFQGTPNHLSIDGLTFITDATEALGEGPNISTGPVWVNSGPLYTLNHLFKDSIFFNGGGTSAGWYNSITTEGTLTETFNYDVTSMTNFNLVWLGRTNTKYTEYGNNSSVVDPGGCTGAGCTPSSSFFPSTSCAIDFNGTGAWAYGSCSGNAVPLTTADYHAYALNSNSPFHNASEYGTDIGAILSAIDAAQTANTYICPYSCGGSGHGPYPTH